MFRRDSNWRPSLTSHGLGQCKNVQNVLIYIFIRLSRDALGAYKCMRM